MTALRFEEARACVLENVRVPSHTLAESVRLLAADGRVLAEDITADRDYPAIARSLRDGFAVGLPAADGGWRVIGEVRAGERFDGRVRAGEAVEIMTGAPVPEGADAVVMVEHVEREGARIRASREVPQGDFINPRGSEARSGEVLVERGRRLGFSEVAMAATVGVTMLDVYRKPRIAILATGDEVVDVEAAPREYQVRNSNSYSIAAQVKRAGGVPEIHTVARDTLEDTFRQIERALRDADLLLLSGGVSAGKYDVVEQVLGEMGAEFFFDRVRIQPGQPLVFGRVSDRFFFGLPGNPGSTMVTFELFARAAVERLGGVEHPPLPITLARLKKPFRQKTGLTRFLPAILDGEGELTPLGSKGSSDVPALARANAFLVSEEQREEWTAGELIRVLLK